MQWHSIHVHYHHPDYDNLLLDAVRPLLARVTGDQAGGYVVRHWRLGPHVRIVVRAEPATFATVVWPAAAEIVGGYLADHPSRARLDPVRLLPLHRRLAELEQEDGPLLPWRPDNSLHAVPHDRRLQVLGGPEAADLLAEFLIDSTDLTFRMTDHIRHHGQRPRLGFDLLAAVAHALWQGGIGYGSLSYRSHAEAFLTAWPEGRGQRSAWDRYYRAHAPALVERIRQVMATIDEPSDQVPFVTEWTELLAGYQWRGYQLITAGRLSMEPARRAQPVPPDPVVVVSEYHRAAEANPWWVRRLRSSPEFGAYRLMLNYTHLQLTRLGITPLERFLICHLVASAVEECFGRSALDLVRGGGAA